MSFFLRSRPKRHLAQLESELSPPTVPGFLHRGDAADELDMGHGHTSGDHNSSTGSTQDQALRADPTRDPRDRWWYESSYELRCGLEVHHDVAIHLPFELIDRMFKR